MNKILAVVVLCLPCCGQAVYSGGYSTGAGILSAATSGSSPLTYLARPDSCITGAEGTCVAGATTGQIGSAMSFMGWNSDPLPFKSLDDPTVPAVANTCFTDPDFGAYVCFATDTTTGDFTTIDYDMGDSGVNDFTRDGTMLKFATSGGAAYLVDIVPSRFHAHTCAPSPSSAKCFVMSQLRNSVTPDSTHFDANATLAIARHSADPANTFYEHNPTQIYRLTITQPKDANGTPTGADTIARTLVVDYTSDSPVPCKVLPTDYHSTWQGALRISDGTTFAFGEGGGGSYQTIWQLVGGSSTPGAPQTVTTEVFIRPVSNNPGGANGNYMFQVTTAGITSGTEPNWNSLCPAKGNTCTDGTAVFTNIGIISGQANGFDVMTYDPGTGCSYYNTRTGHIKRGTGNPDPAGYAMTDDWLSCDRVANVASPGTGTRPCRMYDIWGQHDTIQEMDPNYVTFGVTGGGGNNPTFPGTGSCFPSNVKLNPSTGSGKWVSGTSYAQNDLVFGSDANWYRKSSTGTSSSTGDPTTDTSNWAVANNMCYSYVWDKHTLNVRPLIGMAAPTGIAGGRILNRCPSHHWVQIQLPGRQILPAQLSAPHLRCREQSSRLSL